jgi:hypothetical protein
VVFREAARPRPDRRASQGLERAIDQYPLGPIDGDHGWDLLGGDVPKQCVDVHDGDEPSRPAPPMGDNDR